MPTDILYARLYAFFIPWKLNFLLLIQIIGRQYFHHAYTERPEQNYCTLYEEKVLRNLHENGENRNSKSQNSLSSLDITYHVLHAFIISFTIVIGVLLLLLFPEKNKFIFNFYG